MIAAEPSTWSPADSDGAVVSVNSVFRGHPGLKPGIGLHWCWNRVGQVEVWGIHVVTWPLGKPFGLGQYKWHR
jgi:hypothetical protein